MRIFRVLTAMSILFVLLCGCNGDSGDAAIHSGEETAQAAPAEADHTATVPDERKTPPEGEKLTAKSHILTVNADPVLWPEFLFWLNYIGKYYKSSLGIEEITDWNAQQNGMDLAEFFLSTAVGYAGKDRAIEAKAAEFGIELSPKDLAKIAEERESNIRIYGSVSEYLRIVASMYMSEDVFNYLTRIDYLGNYLFEHFYGQNGEEYSDREVSAFVEDNGFMCARYIFRSGRDADGNALTEEKQAENQRLLEELLGRLEASDTPPALFAELMKTYGEDDAVWRYPNGLLFLPGTRSTAFENACSELKKNEYSGVVSAPEGSYIIMRMPIFPSMTADTAGNTLRYRAAYERFKQQVEMWAVDMNVVYEDAYYMVNVEELL